MLRLASERGLLPPVSGARPLGPFDRARLAGEIVGAYLRARQHLRSAPIETAIASLRAEDAGEGAAIGEAEARAARHVATGAAERSRPGVPADAERDTEAGAPAGVAPGAEPSAAVGAPANLEQARRLGRAVATTLALLPGDTRCLVRSLVLTRLLARRDIPARLVIGARSEPEFLAHAWVECSGAPVLSPGDGSFARLVEL